MFPIHHSREAENGTRKGAETCSRMTPEIASIFNISAHNNRISIVSNSRHNRISKVLTLLLSKGKITPDHINLLKSWKHSGFQVYCGPRILPRKKEAMEYLARYIIRASFSEERMTYLSDESKIFYRSKDNRQEKTFDALDWLAAMCSHIPDQR